MNYTESVVQDCFWRVGGIILGSRTDLHVQIAGFIYRDIILEQHVCLFRGAMGTEFMLMDENALPHRANIDMLGQRAASRQPPSACLPELRRTLLAE
ncbi:transposable element Tcb2 transposase [Trichonephila clavipes]|nr:transposable element Tcb2 transposase [Trichonephila clavipes]